MTSRREFLDRAAASAIGVTLGRVGPPQQPVARRTAAAGFFDLRRPPDGVIAQTEAGDVRLAPEPSDRWTAGAIVVTASAQPTGRRVALSSPAAAVKRLHLRWRGAFADTLHVVGDAWERGYGDLEWRGLVPDRVMPWYVATHDGTLTHAYGVRTGARAFAFWQLDAQGLSLWL